MKTIITVVGIRPDFIRMAPIIKKLDLYFNHILIHSGQHFDDNLSGNFFKELGIRQPDFNLGIGVDGKEHFVQTAELSINLINLIRQTHLVPDLILFLGDSNSVASAVALKKEGYKIGHIEAGMRSGDKRMLEEINRIVCDHCSDFHFVYHENYKKKLLKENISADNIFVVGNTIVESCESLKEKITKYPKKDYFILLDIHRPENFLYENRLRWIINYTNKVSVLYKKPVKMLNFKRTSKCIKDYKIDLGNIELIDLMDYEHYLKYVYECKFIISDSGTGQEEPPLFGTKVIVPREYTERPESMENNCSFMLNESNWEESFKWLDSNKKIKTKWLGDGATSDKIIAILTKTL